MLLINLLGLMALLNFPFKAKPYGDLEFHKEAIALSNYLKGTGNLEEVMITRAPGTTLFYTFPYLVLKSESVQKSYWYAAHAWNILWISLGLSLLIYTIYKAFGSNTAWISLILLGIFPIHIYYSMGISAETPVFVAVCIFIYASFQMYFSKQLSKNIIFAFFFGLLMIILNRPNTLLLLPMILGLVVWVRIKNKKDNVMYRFAKPIVLISILVGLISFGVLQVSKKISEGKSNIRQGDLLALVMHQGRFQLRNEWWDWRYWESDVRPDSKDYQEWKISRGELYKKVRSENKTVEEVFKKFVIDDYLSHPFITIRQFFLKVLYGNSFTINSIKGENFKLLFLKGETGFLILHILINLINIIILIGSICFIWQKRNRLADYYSLWLVGIALILFNGFTYMEPRYLYPFRPCLIVMSAVTISNWIQNITTRYAKR